MRESWTTVINAQARILPKSVAISKHYTNMRNGTTRHTNSGTHLGVMVHAPLHFGLGVMVQMCDWVHAPGERNGRMNLVTQLNTGSSLFLHIIGA